MKQYSSMLLFQYRSDLGNEKSNIMRICEERLILIPARNAKSALSKAKAHGIKAEHKIEEDSRTLYFEFIGVRNLQEVGDWFEEGEVWNDVFKLKQPSERKEKFIPLESDLDAIIEEQK